MSSRARRNDERGDPRGESTYSSRTSYVHGACVESTESVGIATSLLAMAPLIKPITFSLELQKLRVQLTS